MGKKNNIQLIRNTPLVVHNLSGAGQCLHGMNWASSISVRYWQTQVTTDYLTGLIDRYQFESKLKSLIENDMTKEAEHAVLFIDLDQFKVVNDTCGHDAGDELLRQMSLLLGSHIRKQDILARLGGDEFGIILLFCHIEQAQRIAQNLCDAVQQHRFEWENKKFTTTASIGLVGVDADAENSKQVLTSADLACHMAKDEGRDRVYLFHKEDTTLSTTHGQINCLSEISAALDEDRFELFFQAIRAVSEPPDSGEHYEILVRMLNREGEYLNPGVFLPAAERYYMITRIDRWVFKRTCELLSQYPQRLANLNLCAINLSGQSINDARFCEYVLDMLEHYDVPSHKLCFEITETGVIANLSNATQFITRLSEKGVRFALDDFGSGLSSFAYLRHLPVDYIKIDGMFVRDIHDDPIDYAMVKSINEIGQKMGKKTIAEFVENDAILEKLREIGVDYAQGYGIAKPSRFIDFLRAD